MVGVLLDFAWLSCRWSGLVWYCFFLYLWGGEGSFAFCFCLRPLRLKIQACFALGATQQTSDSQEPIIFRHPQMLKVRKTETVLGNQPQLKETHSTPPAALDPLGPELIEFPGGR